MKEYGRLIGFIAAAAVLHAVAVWLRLPAAGGAKPPGGAAAPLELLQSAPPERVPIAPQFAEKQAPEEKAARVSSNIEKGPEADVSGEKQPEVREQKPEIRDQKSEISKPKPAVSAESSAAPQEVRSQESALDTRHSPPATPQIVRTAADLQKAVNELSREQKSTVTTGMTAADYKTYLKQQNIGRVKGESAPQLLQAWRDLSEQMEVHRYFGLKLVALNPASAQSVTEVLGFGAGEVSWQRIEKFNWDAYSNRIDERTSPYFEELRKRMLRDGAIGPDDILCSVAPASADSYFRYKQLENIRRAGFKPEQVQSVLVRYRRTGFGWIMEVSELHLNDGRLLPVQDFEVAELGSAR